MVDHHQKYKKRNQELVSYGKKLMKNLKTLDPGAAEFYSTHLQEFQVYCKNHMANANHTKEKEKNKLRKTLEAKKTKAAKASATKAHNAKMKAHYDRRRSELNSAKAKVERKMLPFKPADLLKGKSALKKKEAQLTKQGKLKFSPADLKNAKASLTKQQKRTQKDSKRRAKELGQISLADIQKGKRGLSKPKAYKKKPLPPKPKATRRSQISLDDILKGKAQLKSN